MNAPNGGRRPKIEEVVLMSHHVPDDTQDVSETKHVRFDQSPC